MAVIYSPAASLEAANLHGPTLQKARSRFCKHPVTALSEANCEEQMRAARAQVPDHGVKHDEFFPTCYSNVREEVMDLTQPERSRTTTRNPPTSSRGRSVLSILYFNALI